MVGKKEKRHHHIYNLQGKPAIFKYVDEKRTYFGRYENIDDAIKYRNMYIANDWDRNFFKRIYTTYKQQHLKNTERYIYKTSNGKWGIRRVIDGNVKLYGTFSKKEYAIEERNLLIDSNWDLMTYYESY